MLPRFLTIAAAVAVSTSFQSSFTASALFEEIPLSEKCSKHGILLNRHCYCTHGWKGDDCSQISCYPKCSMHGVCEIANNVAKCVCDQSFSGPSCSISNCPNNCNEKSGHGKCVELPPSAPQENVTTGIHGEKIIIMKECFCHPKWTGRDCAAPRSLRLVNNNETVTNATNPTEPPVQPPGQGPNCPIISHFDGEQIYPVSGTSKDNYFNYCQFMVNKECTGMCKAPKTRGRCREECDKFDPETTPKPGEPDAPKPKPKKPTPNSSPCPGDDGPCNGNGLCDVSSEKCVCSPGWLGEDCSELPCPNNCNADNVDERHGDCIDDVCVCRPAWEGDDCGTPTEIQTDLPCAQDCPGDCEHADECDGFNLRYWVPIFHKEAWTTDRIYNWVTPKTGQNHQWELNEANSLGHPVPKDESGQATAARDCYLSCVKTCASKCFYALQRLPDTERNKVVEIQKLAKRLPGITGNQINDENLETSLQKQGKAPSHPDYSPKELINFLKELTKSTEGGTPITNDEVGEKEEKELVNSKQNNTFYDRPDTPGETATGGREEAQ